MRRVVERVLTPPLPSRLPSALPSHLQYHPRLPLPLPPCRLHHSSRGVAYCGTAAGTYTPCPPPLSPLVGPSLAPLVPNSNPHPLVAWLPSPPIVRHARARQGRPHGDAFFLLRALLFAFFLFVLICDRVWRRTQGPSAQSVLLPPSLLPPSPPRCRTLDSCVCVCVCARSIVL